MITNNQISALSEEELVYLLACFMSEWSENNSNEFKFNYIKFWRNDAVQHALNKYANYLPNDKKHLIINILSKLEENIK